MVEMQAFSIIIQVLQLFCLAWICVCVSGLWLPKHSNEVYDMIEEIKNLLKKDDK